MYESKLCKLLPCSYEAIETLFLQESAPHRDGKFIDGEKVNTREFFYQKGPEVHMGVSDMSFCVVKDEDGTECVKRRYNTREAVYNIDTKELESDLDDDDLSTLGVNVVIDFCTFVIDGNQYIISALKKLNEEGFIGNRKTAGDVYVSYNKAAKLYHLCTENQGLLESLIKENPTIFSNNSAFSTLDIDEKSVKKAIGLPPAAVEFLTTKKYQGMIPYFQVVCKDGNDAIILVDFLKSCRPLTKKRRDVRESLSKVLANFSTIVEAEPSYTVSELIRYSLTQTMHHSIWDINGLINVTTMWRDWITVAKDFGVVERFPNNIFEAHDIMSRNTSGYTQEDEKKFTEVAETLDYLKWNYTANPGTVDEKRYVFIVPQTLKDLIQEGVSLSHCIGTWGRKIIKGDTRIVFMREANAPGVSLATLEIGVGGDVIQAKIKYNEDLPPELDAVAREYQSHLHRKHII